MKTKFGKTIAGVALLFCAYGAGGCHGDLDIMQDNKLSASNMWKEESDATSATYGLYVYLRSALKSMNDVYLCWGELRNGLWGPGTHNTLNGVDQSQVRTSTMSSVNEYADWTALYTTVNQANLVIRHVPAMGLKEKPRAFCLGNAHFIRAYCFFQIARIWGDAPLPLWGYESTDTELFLGRTPVSEVLMRVERDIADAERYVADTSDKTVATPAAVAMLKADYALWMYRMQAGGEAYLAMAQEALGELGLSDALLEPAYADIFSSSNKCGREVIFAVHQDVSEALNGPAYYLGWNESYVEAAYRNNPVPTTGGNQWWWYTDTYRALLQADPADTRAALTCRTALLDNVVVTCTAITPATKPAAPGGVSFDAAAAADRLTLKWNAVPDATSYTVAYWKGSASAPESEYAYKTGIASTATSQELTNLESNTSYWAKVKAVGSLDSDWSETANATTMDSGGEPLLPTADLLDVVFRNDGSAMDNSSSATPVRRMPSSRP